MIPNPELGIISGSGSFPLKSTVKFVNLRPFLVVYSLPLFFVFVVVVVTGLEKKRFKQTTIFIFPWSAMDVVFNIPPIKGTIL